MHPGSIIALLHLCVTTWLIVNVRCQLSFFHVSSMTAEAALEVLYFPLIFLMLNARDYYPSPLASMAWISFVSIASAYLWGYSIALGTHAIAKMIGKTTRKRTQPCAAGDSSTQRGAGSRTT